MSESSEEHIIVSTADLEKAMSVWLVRMPKAIWRELEKHELLALQKRQGPRPDVHRSVAAYIAGRMAELGWTVSHAKRENIFRDLTAPEREAAGLGPKR